MSLLFREAVTSSGKRDIIAANLLESAVITLSKTRIRGEEESAIRCPKEKWNVLKPDRLDTHWSASIRERAKHRVRENTENRG